MAVDDLTIEFGACENPVDCNFEDGLCDWQEETTSVPYWELYAAQNGPHDVLVDHTVNSELGDYFLKSMNVIS